MKRPVLAVATTIVAVIAIAHLLTSTTSGRVQYEVWAMDQSNSPGKAYGGALYIWDGTELEKQKGVKGPEDSDEATINPLRWMRPPASEKIDLGGDASTLCLAKTGANPVRPHMIAANPAQTHIVITFVVSGHVLFVDADTREPIECFRMSVGAGGLQQAHMATPSPDGTYVTVANQNGKLFERISTDYENNVFIHDTAATLDLAGCTTPGGLPCQSADLRPDNAPICPITESTSRFTFVTLRGGGLFVVDSQATPMQIVAEYDKNVVHGNGCLGAESLGKMYIDSGGGTAANETQADL
jgi:hypothetical protein